MEVAYASQQLLTGGCKYEKDSGQAIYIIGDQQLFSPYSLSALSKGRC